MKSTLQTLLIFASLVAPSVVFAQVSTPLAGGQLEQCVVSPDGKNLELKFMDYKGETSSLLFAEPMKCVEARNHLIEFDFPVGICGCSHKDAVSVERWVPVEGGETLETYTGPGFEGRCLQLSIDGDVNKGFLFETRQRIEAVTANECVEALGW